VRSVSGSWATITPAQLNRLLRPYNVRLVMKVLRGTSPVDVARVVMVTAEPIEPKEPAPDIRIAP
jgi:hypothetical protein